MLDISRREFIAATLAAGLCSWKRPVNAAEPRQRQMTIDLVCGAIGVRANQREAIAFAHQHGFESVQPDAGDLAKLSDLELQDLLGQLSERGLKFGAAGLPVDFRNDEAKFDQGLSTLPQSAAALQRAGVTRVGTWLSPANDDLTYVQNFRQHARRLRAIAQILLDHGLRFGLEYVGPKTSWTAKRHAFVHTMAETKDLLAEIDRPNMGFVLDSWHWYTARETRADLLTLTNKDIVAVDLNDAPAGLAIDEQMDLSRELPCATGVIDLATFLNALQEIGYDGPVRAEPFNAALRMLPPDKAVAATAAAMKQAFALIKPS